MKNITQHTGILTVIGRLPSSANGNPRYRLEIDGFSCRAAVDCSLGYSVTNYDGCKVIATIGTHYGYATLNSVKKAE